MRAAVEQFGLTGGRARRDCPSVPMHDADAPRIAIYSQWNGTQDLGWYRLTFDKFGIPYDLIYKERVTKGNLEGRLRRHHHGGAEPRPRGRCSRRRRRGRART